MLTASYTNTIRNANNENKEIFKPAFSRTPGIKNANKKITKERKFTILAKKTG